MEIEALLTDWELEADYMLQEHEWRAAEMALSGMDRARAIAILEGPLPRTRKRDLGIDLVARLIAAAPPGVLLDAHTHESAIDHDDASLVWSRSNLLPQLQEAARRGTVLVMERDDGKLESVRVTRVAQQGSLWMVLGERTADELGVAYPLNRITALAHDSGSTATLLDASAATLAGHLPCPCGSGKRYRQCCRTP